MSTPRFALETPSPSYGEPLPAAAFDEPPTGWVARVGYLFAALLLLGTLFASVNPTFGHFGEEAGWDAHRWPWQALLEADGRLSWRPESAWIVALGGSALLLLVAVFLSARARSLLGILAAIIVGIALLPVEESHLPFAGLGIAVAVLFAAAAAGNAAPLSPAPLRLALGASVLLAGLLFIPLPSQSEEVVGPASRRDYHSFGVDTIKAVEDVFQGEQPGQPSPLSKARLLLPFVAWVLSLGVGILMVLGLGRPWAPWALGVFLLVVVLAYPIDAALSKVEEGRSVQPFDEPFTSQDVFQHLARGASETIALAERLILLPLALALIDLLRPRREGI